MDGSESSNFQARNCVQSAVMGQVVQAGIVHGGVHVTDTTTAEVPHELPASTAHFVGRAAELARIHAALTQSGSLHLPIVVLSGTAGVGKTALAVRWAHSVVSQFPDGQLYVDLRGFGPDQPLSPMEALSRFLRSLGMSRPEELTSSAERAARFRTMMSRRRAVVILDNAYSEHQVAPLFPGVGSCAVVVTSRLFLGGLHVRYAAEMVRLEPLADETGIRLLAAAVGSRLRAEAAAATTLATLCAGLPLALRIVAKRIVSQPSLKLEDLVAELKDERTRLESFSATYMPTTMRTIFSWSYRQLDDLTAKVFRALGLGPLRDFNPAAIAAVSGLPRHVVKRALIELDRVHLVREVSNDRYDMHDLLRVYAGEITTTQDASLRTAAMQRLFDYFLHTADRAERLLTPHRFRIPLEGDPRASMDIHNISDARHWLRTEEANMVALCREDDPALDTRRWQLAYVLRSYFYRTRQLDGWVDSQTHALAAVLRTQNVWAEATTRNNLGVALVSTGLLTQAMGHFEQAKHIFEKLGDGHGRSNALANIASVLRRQGDRQTALICQYEALAYYQQSGALRNSGITLRSIAGVHLELGQPAEAVRYAEEAVLTAERLEHDLDIAQACNILGTAHQRAGQLSAAQVALTEALRRAVRCESRFEQARAFRGLGTCTARKVVAPGHDIRGSRWDHGVMVMVPLRHHLTGTRLRLCAL